MLQADVVKVFVVGDSATSLQFLGGTATDVSLKAVAGKVNNLVDLIMQKLKKLEIKYVWLPNPCNPADYNSKVQLEPTERSNSQL